MQVPDFAAWQRATWTDEALRPQLDYWRGQLAGAPLLELPSDRPRPEREDPRGALAPFAFDASLLAGLTDLSRASGTTLYMTILAGFAALLGRLAATGDVVLGSVVAGRERREIEGLIGFFPNTLVLRSDLKGGPTVSAHLARVRSTVLAAFANQDLPFEKLVQGVHPDRHNAQNPFFGVAFALNQALPDESQSGGLTVEIEPVPSATAKFDLYLEMVSGPQSLAGTFEYRTALFDRTTIARWTGHLLALLAGLAAEPGRRIDDIPLLSPAERQQLTREWSDTAADYPRDATLPRLFARQVEERANEVALVHGETTLTYGDLARRASTLAARLTAAGVGPEVPVALALGRSFDLIVAILAVLEAGGFYLPLDPSYPRERLAFMLADSGARVLLTPRSRAARLPSSGIAVLCLDEIDLLAGTEAPAVPVRPADLPADALAYVMYTSGSTGAPKGVAVTHRNVARLVLGNGFARFGPDEVFLQLAPVSFDASTLEIWGPLLNGGRLVLFSGEQTALQELGQAIRDHGVTTLWLTAGLFHQMVERQLPLLSGLRQLLAGGDVLSPARLREALAALPGTALINGYGPTEGTTFTCCHTMQEAGEVGDPVPIGRPIANTRAVVLGGDGEPVPLGAIGELCAGGDGVARGYLNRPELTAERFVPDPTSEMPGGRLYRTGDRVRTLPSGRIEFLGRLDRQVKIRGFRIEPGEVEAVLAQHPGVREAAVVVRAESGTAAAGGRLVAYVARKPEGERADSPALRDFLASRLPEHMVPTAFVHLDALPLTPQGKVDRAALPAPAAPAPAVRTLPESETERLLARLWREVLGLASVGIDDNFFDLGGHSLALAAVHDRLCHELGPRGPRVELFVHPTHRKLSGRLAGRTAQAVLDRSEQGGLQRSATAWKERAKQARQG
ncbi:MAG TPA: amino acid adenylation domain-containing protein, partial [Thermoanaerobaculia bacterium]